MDAYEFELNGVVYTREKDGTIIEEGRGPAPARVTLTTRDLMNIASTARQLSGAGMATGSAVNFVGLRVGG